MSKTTFDRQQLYDLVWAEPLLTLSKKYNISDVGLRKICIRMDVSLPAAGYWAKVQHGKKTDVKLLPQNHYGQKEAVLYLRDENHPATVDGMTPQAAMQALIEREYPTELRITGEPNDPDPLIIKAHATLLKRNKYYRAGDILNTESGQLNIRVSDPQINRALCIMDAIVKIMRKRGREFKFRNEITYIVIGEKKSKWRYEKPARLRSGKTAGKRENFIQMASWNSSLVVMIRRLPAGMAKCRWKIS